MKKLASIFILFLAFSFGANAQTKTARSVEELSLIASKQNTLEITNAIGVSGEIQGKIFDILVKKNNGLLKGNVTEVEKKEVSATANKELKAILSKDQIEKLQAIGLYEKMIN